MKKLVALNYHDIKYIRMGLRFLYTVGRCEIDDLYCLIKRFEAIEGIYEECMK